MRPNGLGRALNGVMRKKLGAAMKEKREHLGVTHEWIAKHCTRHSGLIKNLEDAKCDHVDLELFMIVCKAYELNPLDFYRVNSVESLLGPF